ncbi:MAG: ferrochelatase [Nitrospirae bacterium]|nr:ferrochelatase [Nitrospirota bacterium]
MVQSEDSTTGVLLLNLGGPDSLEAVRPFLYNLFSDRDIIRLGPPFMQKPLAYLISALRHKKTESYYRQIGGKSPILDITTRQAMALEEELRSAKGSEEGFKVFVGMRYWHPLIENVIPQIYEAGIRRLIVLSLYPHYSIATTGSSLARLKEVITGFPIGMSTISSWYDHPLYIDALVDSISEGIDMFGAGPAGVHVLFSAHSLPKKFIEEGDPYVDHIRATISEITKKIDIPWDLSYQSKSGPVEWLEPSTDEILGALAKKGVKNLLVVPVSFVSDHIETLYEIDILYKKMAGELGMRLERAESLNTSPVFISALRDIVMKGTRDAGWAA